MIYIGIDPGVKTGVAVWDSVAGKFLELETYTILRAIDKVQLYDYNGHIMVMVEDARKWKFGTDPKKKQGAGSIKRDCKIWEEFLTDRAIDHELTMPNKKITKLSVDAFHKITGIWTMKTHDHIRDAAMLVFDRK